MADQTPSLDAIKRRAEQVNRRHRTPNEVASDFSRNERDRATTRASTLLEKAETQAPEPEPERASRSSGLALRRRDVARAAQVPTRNAWSPARRAHERP